MMNVHEVFDSLQGEGLSIGRQTTFIRFSGCNLACSWCDTPLDAPGTERMDSHDVLKLVKAFGNTMVCLTGGEPLLQKKEVLEDLVELLYANRYVITVETNGTLLPTSIVRDLVSGWAVSPKLPSSGNPMTKDLLLRFVKYVQIKMQFKFAIRDEEDVAYCRDLLEYISEYPIVLTPVGGALEHLVKLYEDTRGMFKGYDLRYLPQLHKCMKIQ